MDLGQGVVSVVRPVKVQFVLHAGVKHGLSVAALAELHRPRGALQAQGILGELGGAATLHLQPKKFKQITTQFIIYILRSNVWFH